ncbi:cobaltochelatase subunit CobN [uncultured Methanolobus sp.]|uniref:cobaltochelatase subunit CobN n=1 Tax=uncultured Methanolobus sp. TaxID=218300 RepID=UPI002AAA77A0|nr:cobaltochelatase subunit CobN [uncultured Methanolobus sp.]
MIKKDSNWFGIAGKAVLIFLLCVVMLSANAVALDVSQFELVSNIESDSNGNYLLTDIPNGNYTLIAVNETNSSKSGLIYYKEQMPVTVSNSDFSDFDLSLDSSDLTEYKEICSLLDHSNISGRAYYYSSGMNREFNKACTIVMLDSVTQELVKNTTSDPLGNYLFTGIPNGNYTLIAVNETNSSKSGLIYYKKGIDVSVNNSDVSDFDLSLDSSDLTEYKEICSLLNLSDISGRAYYYSSGMNREFNKACTIVMLDPVTQELVKNTTSDSSGNYLLTDIPNGNYTLIAVNETNSSKSGLIYYKKEIDVSVNNSNLSNFDLSLDSSDLTEYKEICSFLSLSDISGRAYYYSSGMNREFNKACTIVLLKPKSTYRLPVAGFSIDKTSGETPLSIQFTDKSLNTESWFWDFGDGSNSTDKNPSHTYLSEGTFTVELTVTNSEGSDVETKKDLIIAQLPDPITIPNYDTTFKLFLSTTSDSLGNYLFTGIPNGNYTLIAVNETNSSKSGLIYYKREIDVLVNNSDVSDFNLSLDSSDLTEYEDICSLLDRSNISGRAYYYSSGMNREFNKACTIVMLDPVTQELVKNTTSDGSGNYLLTDIPNGNYTLIAVNETNSSKSGLIYYKEQMPVTVNNSDVSDFDLSLDSSDLTEYKEICSLLNLSDISGRAYYYSSGMNREFNKACTIVMLDPVTQELVKNTTSDSSGNYLFTDIPNGNYTLIAVNETNSSKSGLIYYKKEIDVSVNNSDLSNFDLSLDSSDLTEYKEICSFLSLSDISGRAYYYSSGMNREFNKACTILLLEHRLVQSLPVADFSANQTSGKIPLSVKFTDESSNAESWFWDFGDGSNSTNQNPSHTYLSDGTFTVELTVTNTAGSDAEIKSDFITVNASSSSIGSYGVVYDFFLSTSCNNLGEFSFADVPNGEYRIAAINWSTAMAPGMWLTNVTDVTVDDGAPVDVGKLSMRKNYETIDHDDILSMLNESSISGKTIGKYLDNKISTVILTNQFGEYVANTTCNEDGEFLFTGIRNGEYTVSAVNWSTAMAPGMWLTNVTDVTVEYAQPVNVGNLSMRKNYETIDHDAILSMLNETSISGKTIGKNLDNKISTVLLTNQFGEYVANTTCNVDGEFLFTGIRNGEYTVSAVNWSTAMAPGMWLTNVTDVTVEYAQPVDVGNLSMRKNYETIDHDAIFALLDRTTISGKTIGKNLDDKLSDVILMRIRTVSVSNEPHLNVSFVTGYSSYENELEALAERINSDSSLNMNFSYYVTTNLPENIDLSNEDIVYIVMVTQSASILEDSVQEAIDNGALVIGKNTYLPESSYEIPEDFTELSDFKDYLAKYWAGGSSDELNFDNLIFYLAQEYYGREDFTVEEPTGLDSAIYHPAMTTTPTEYFTNDADEYFNWYANRTDGHAFDENAATVGITFYKSYYPDDMDPIDKLIEGFESNCLNTVACYGGPSYYLEDYLNHSAETKVDVVVSFHYRGNYFDIEALDVPVMNAVLNGYMNTSEWLETSTPLPETNMLRIYGPETEGLIDPIMIGAKETIDVDNTSVEKYIGHDEQIDWLIDRTIAQAELGTEYESNKKVVILYYNHGGGKDNIGASYLEVMPSIVNLLEGMADEGYDINSSLIPNKTELVDLITYQGRNVGTWAPGELEALVETGEVELIPESTYLSWFNEFPEERREEVIDMWGEAPGEIMVYTDENGNKFIVVPKINISDNVILAPQPTRGWLQDSEVLYHATDLPPHHQYIAFYLWLQHEFDADVMVNMGRHGTVEWLPGKDFCLLSDEWPALMVGDIPVIYPYVMDGMGEGMQAKRRGNAIIIDHLIPPVVSAGLYGNYSSLSSDITSYQTLSTENEELKQSYLQSIVNLTLDLGLDEQVDMSLAEDETTIDEFLEELDDILTELKSQSMPYGLHVLGEAPEGESLVGTVNSMLGSDFTDLVAVYNSSDDAPTDLLSLVLLDNMSTTDAQVEILGTSDVDVGSQLNTSINYAELLGEADNEVQQVLNAMDGEYISANLGGDPVLRSSTLPSGSNFYAFDELLIPTEEAWNQGKELVDTWLAEYYAENGEYPTKVGYILWAGESTRHQGVMESQLLYMMGIKPVWNADNSEVEDVEVIDSSELGRPRIDVLVQISGLYRDTFPMKVKLIDKAVRLAYQEGETDVYDNYVTQNTDLLQLALNETIQDGNLSLDIAQFRVFGPADGAYGTGMANAVDSSETWNETSELAELYVSKMSYVYGENVWGQTISEYIEQQTGRVVDIDNSVVFENNLNGTSAIFHSRSSSTYGSLDTDDFYQYMGGLYNAIKYITGTGPDTYVVNLQDLNDAEIQTLQTYLTNELYARYLNPSWIAGMQLSGFEGAREMSEFLENLWGWEALNPDIISDDVWDSVYDTYMNNAELSSWMQENNPYAYQSMIARMTETIRKNGWEASDNTLSDLVSQQIKSVNENGATCCHHTCGNILNQEFITGIAQALVESGELTQAELDKYLAIMKEATTSSVVLKDTSVRTSTSSDSLNSVQRAMASGATTNQSSTSESGGAGVNTVQPLEEGSKSTPDDYVEGYEMTQSSVSDESSPNSPPISGSDVLAMGFVAVLLGSVYIGFWRKRKF